MWELYDALIEGIPRELTAEKIMCGSKTTVVINAIGTGVSSSVQADTRLPVTSGNLIGAPLREVAGLVKSWNLIEASIGHAAINSYYNSPPIARRAGIEFSDSRYAEDRINDPFITSQNIVKGKKVAVVGHFPYLETFFEPICDMSIIEWAPVEQGDYPYSASEYIIPECDYVFITSLSFVNKTLPRLLELSRGAALTTVVGHSTTLAPYLLTKGIGNLAGFIVKDSEKALRIACGAENAKLSSTGQKVSFKV